MPLLTSGSPFDTPFAKNRPEQPATGRNAKNPVREVVPFRVCLLRWRSL